MPKAAPAKPDPVEEYLAAVPEPAQTSLRKVRQIIRSAVPPETTEGISYRVPMFKYKGPLIGFAAFSDHCSLLVASGTVLDQFAAETKHLSTSKGTIRFPLDKPLPAALIRKLVKARVAEQDAKKKSR